MSTIETVSSTYGGYMAKDKELSLQSGETWALRISHAHIGVVGPVGRVMVNLKDVDAFCEALKVFRDEVTKPKMTGGEKVYAAEVTAWGWPNEWADLSLDHKARYEREAELLGIKDDE